MMLSFLTNFTPLKWLKVGLLVAALLAAWYGVDSFAFKPLRECKVNTKEQLDIRDTALNEAGDTISSLINELQVYRSEAKAKRLEGVYGEIDKIIGGNFSEDFNINDFNITKYSY